jgi:hypothetical protein
MSRIGLAVEKGKRPDENQADALMGSLELRESRQALRQQLNAEIEVAVAFRPVEQFRLFSPAVVFVLTLAVTLGVSAHLPALIKDIHVEPNSNSSLPAGPGQTQHLTSLDQVPQGLGASDWSSIRAQYEQRRYAVFPIAGRTEAWQTRNPGQQWRIRFDARGFLVQPDGADWQWGLELARHGFADHARTVSAKAQVAVGQDRVAYQWDDALEEWFLNGSRGLEHGFTVRRRPPGSSTLNFDESRPGAQLSDPLNITLAVRGTLRPEVTSDGLGVRFVDGQGTTVLTYAELKAWDADGRTLPVRFKPVAPGENALQLSIDERGARYPLTIDPIAQQAYVKASNTGNSDAFGHSVSVSGDTVVVGANSEDSNATGVNGDDSDNSASESGAAYVFVRSGTNWSQQAYLKASNADPGDYFGYSVAVSGDTVVVGAIWEDSNAIDGPGDNNAFDAGAAYVFVRSGTNWSQQAYLKASNPDIYDDFGSCVAVSGDTVVVGAPYEASSAVGVNGTQSDNSASGSGAAYVFVHSGTNWSQQAYLKASNTGAGDTFGESVTVSGDTVVVGANGEASNATGVNGDQTNNSAAYSGAAYVFVRSGADWSQQAYLKASNTEEGDSFGSSVAVSGDTVVVGAFSEDSNATGVNGNQTNNSASDSGAAYVFVRGGTNWSQQAYLKASNAGVSDVFPDYFGYSVAVSGDTIVVGAIGEDSMATGVNGNQTNNFAGNSGAAYVFVRNGTNWSQQAYLKASNTGGDDWFGNAVAVSGGSVVVGALQEDSSATGVNGDGSDNYTPDSGAAYIFTGVGPFGPVRLTPIAYTNGVFQFEVSGPAGPDYVIQTSTNLVDWTGLATNLSPATPFQFNDTGAESNRHRLYRARVEP